jgi:hypothetical protein
MVLPAPSRTRARFDFPAENRLEPFELHRPCELIQPGGLGLLPSPLRRGGKELQDRGSELGRR